MTVIRRRKKPVEVDTIQWTGDNEADVQAFCGPGLFLADATAADDASEATATVYDRLHSTWVGVYTGQHIVRGVQGEYYPIAEDVLAETYEQVAPGPEAPEAPRQDFTRVTALYEQWVKAGPPPFGTSLARWWDARLVELREAILPTSGQTREQ